MHRRILGLALLFLLGQVPKLMLTRKQYHMNVLAIMQAGGIPIAKLYCCCLEHDAGSLCDCAGEGGTSDLQWVATKFHHRAGCEG